MKQTNFRPPPEGGSRAAPGKLGGRDSSPAAGYAHGGGTGAERRAAMPGMKAEGSRQAAGGVQSPLMQRQTAPSQARPKAVGGRQARPHALQAPNAHREADSGKGLVEAAAAIVWRTGEGKGGGSGKRWAEPLRRIGWDAEAFDNGTGQALTDYGEYRLSRRQFWEAAIAGYAVAAAAVYLFYHSWPVSLALGFAGFIAPKLYKQRLLIKRQERLKLQFKEALYSLTSSLAAGRSVENAFMAALEDLKLLYPDPRTELIREFQVIRNRLINSEPLEYALRSLAERAHLDDLTQFADVFAACKRSGGDLVEVMKRTSQTIGEKLDVQQEIAVMIAQKRFEARIMMAVPFVFLGFLHLSAPDYMAPLYGGAGYVLLTAVLGVLLLCFRFVVKIMDIRM